MSSFGFKVDGFAEIEAALQDLRSVRTRKAALKRGMMIAAEPMAEIARSLAPVSSSDAVAADPIPAEARPARKAKKGRATAKASFLDAGLSHLPKPARKHRATRHLRDTIGVGDKLTRRQASLAAGEDQDGDITIYVGAGAKPAAVQQEFGNVNHPPHPFMRPAWDQDSRALLLRLGEVVRDEVFKSLARQRRRG